MPTIEMVVAIAENGIIGKNGKMPWRLPSDMAHFKKVTMGHAVVMGRKTFESIGKPLPGRTNIVIGRSTAELPDDVLGVRTAEAAIAAAGEAERVMIIGGGQIYRIFEPMADTIHLTQVHAAPQGDTHFTLAAAEDWREVDRQRFPAGENDSADYSFITLKRR